MADGQEADVVATAAAALYALPSEEFTAARTARVAELKKAGDRASAAAVSRLAKPTVAASLVDRLVRERPDVVHALLATGADLRRAQEELDAARLKALGVERRQRVTEAVDAAAELAAGSGRAPGPAVLDEVGDTLTAAVLDEAAAGAVASGRLVRSLPADGLEGAAVEELVALPDAPPVLAPEPTAKRAGAVPAPAQDDHEHEHEDRVAAAARRDAEHAVADAERARDRARRAEQDADDDLADADRRRDEADSRVGELRDRIAELQRRLDSAEEDLRTADREVRDRRGDQRAARRAAEDAEDALAGAQARLESLA